MKATSQRRAADGLWLYGIHPTRSALANPVRRVKRAILTSHAADAIGRPLLARVRHEIATSDAVSRLVPPGAVHQGAAILCEPLPRRDIEDVLREKPMRPRAVLVLDQISDPHNVGAILRSAAAFGVAAVVVQDRHAPPESGVLAKSASGALDIVPYVQVVNIARTLETLAKAAFWRVALAGDGDQPIREALREQDVAIVLGSEGSGIRRLVRQNCDTSAFIPIVSQMESLNVSNAAAIALYEFRRQAGD